MFLNIEKVSKMKSEAVKTRYGLMNIPTSDAVLGPSLRLYGEWAQDEIEGLVKFLKDGDVVIDAGANIGTHTLGFASAIAPSGRVYSFEPQADIYELLHQNCSINNYVSNIVTYCHPLSNDSGKKYLIPVFDDNNIHNFGAAQLAVEAVDKVLSIESSESMTIDGLNLDSCRLIKLDVEGMELEVLSGAETLIVKCKPLIFFEANTIASTWKIIQKFISLGEYSVRVVISDAFSPQNFNENKLNIFSDYQETSILLYPERENALVETAFKRSIYITNYAELAIALAVLCRRPPGHPLFDLASCDNELKDINNDNFDGLAISILRELIYQREKNAALNQENATLNQENATLNQENATLNQENATLNQENATLSQELSRQRETSKVLSEHLRKYQMFPPIRLIRKLRTMVVSFADFGKH